MGDTPTDSRPESMTLDWKHVAPEFEFDGSWRDIYVHDTTLADWQAALDALRQSSFEVLYTTAGLPATLPVQAADAFPEEGRCDRLLAVRFAGVTFQCHFFDAGQLEFDIDPREITGQSQLDAVVAFMRLLSKATEKPVELTPENAPKGSIFLVSPNAPNVEYFPCLGAAG